MTTNTQAVELLRTALKYYERAPWSQPGNVNADNGRIARSARAAITSIEAPTSEPQLVDLMRMSESASIETLREGLRLAISALCDIAAAEPAPTSERVQGASIDTHEFVAMLDAYCRDGTDGYQHHYEKIIAHIKAWHASETARLVGADEGGTQMVTRLMTEINELRASQSASVEDAKPLAHGHRDDYYLMANARHLAEQSIAKINRMPNWVFAAELFATGSTSACKICRDAGIDPDGLKVERVSSTGKHGGESAS